MTFVTYGLSIILTCVGSIFGYYFRIFYERKLNKNISYDNLKLNKTSELLKQKLDIYWLIYFKLLICLSAKNQIKKLRSDQSEFINIEKYIILQNLDEVVNLLCRNISIINPDDYLLNLILRFINHVIIYNGLRQLKIYDKNPSDFECPYPDNFTVEITKRTLNLQKEYNKYLDVDSDKILNTEEKNDEQQKLSLIVNKIVNDNRINTDSNDIEDVDDINISDIDIENIFSNRNVSELFRMKSMKNINDIILHMDQ
jgi:hypothetical protein